MDDRLALQLLQAGRTGLGAALVVAPGPAGAPWIGEPAHSAGGQVALRALGIRDAVLGLGAMRAARRGDATAAASWATALAVCDVVDGVATCAARRTLPSRGVPVMALAFGAAAAGLLLASRISPD